jgi:nitrite reductase/ring-hydroxylating ferredoxin subunit
VGVSLLLDVIGQTVAGDVTLLVGVLTMLVAAVPGLADYTDTDGNARTRATVHATLMIVAVVVYVVSLVLRAGGPDRALPIVLSVIGFAIVNAGAFVGGDVVYVLGNMVSRHAFRGAGTKWIRLEPEGGADPATMPEATPLKAKLGINTLVLVRVGDTVHALHETCAHAGGPLSQGTVVDGCIQCPWHGSRFRLTDGHLRRGPTVYDQPVYEVRQGEAGWEARRTS